MATRPTKSELAQQRMTKTMLELAKRRGRLPALVTAVGIALVLLVQSLVASLIGWVSAVIAATASFGGEAFNPGFWSAAGIVESFLAVSLPLAIGVFVSLWVIAPIADELTVPFVLTRGALAAIVGAIVVLVVALFIALVLAFATARSGAEVALGLPFFDLRGFVQGVIGAFGTAASTFIYSLPLVLFASVLEWLWLRAHPRAYAVVGLVDEL